MVTLKIFLKIFSSTHGIGFDSYDEKTNFSVNYPFSIGPKHFLNKNS